MKINPYKSKVMIVCKAIYRNVNNNISLVTNDHEIKQIHKIKALSMYFTSGLSNHANVKKHNFKGKLLIKST